MMKKLFSLILFMTIICWSVVAQSSTKHIVASGESITYIAKKYGISKNALITANPQINQNFYVGMELQIPMGGTPSNLITPNHSYSYESGNNSEMLSIVALAYQMKLGNRKSMPNRLRNYYGLTYHLEKYWNRMGLGASLLWKSNNGIAQGKDFGYETSKNKYFASNTFSIGPNLCAKLTQDGRLYAILPITFMINSYYVHKEKHLVINQGFKDRLIHTPNADPGCGIYPSIGIQLGNLSIITGLDIVMDNKHKVSRLQLSLGYTFRHNR